jgi:chemotaxis protein CheX
MYVDTKVTTILHGSYKALEAVVPFPLEYGKTSVLTKTILKESIGVKICLTGDIEGELIFDSQPLTYKKVGEAMFDIELSDEMLESFAAELGNMIAGNLATQLADEQIEMDITPPTILFGQIKLSGFEKAVHVPIQISQAGSLHLILISEK